LLVQRQVGAGDRMAEVEQQMTQTAHPAATRPDEINRTVRPHGLQQVAYLDWIQRTHATFAVCVSTRSEPTAPAAVPLWFAGGATRTPLPAIASSIRPAICSAASGRCHFDKASFIAALCSGFS